MLFQRNHKHGIIITLLVLILVICFSACETKSSSKSILYTCDTDNPGDNSLFLVQGETTEDTIELIMMASYIIAGRAYGTAFDLDFNPSVLEYIGMEKGSYFEDKEQFVANYMVAFQSDSDSKLVIGISQQGKKYGVIGKGTLIRFKFRGIAEGESPIRFSNNSLLNPEMEKIQGISWYGGKIRVER